MGLQKGMPDIHLHTGCPKCKLKDKDNVISSGKYQKTNNKEKDIHSYGQILACVNSRK